jgi:hypothetical protein
VLEVGSEIEGYRIERELGRGGMGEVYEATQLALGRTVAFKVLHTRLGQDEAFRERFRREGQMQAALDHPNVVTVYEAGELDGGGLFLAMRLVSGQTLKQLIVTGELDAARALRLLEPIADALDAAHQAGLVHRDVKPQNILVGAGDHPFLADFGLTRGAAETSGLTASGQFIGTIDYIAPEQVRGEPAGPASDVYALAAVLHECLTGSVPYPRPSDAAVLYAHVNDDPPSVCAARPDLPQGIDAAVKRGMAKQPEDRPRSAHELIAAAAGELDADPALAESRPPARDALAHGVRPAEGDTEEAPAGAPTAPGRRADPSSGEPAGQGPATRGGRPSVSPAGARRSPRAALVAAVAATIVLAGGAFALGQAGGDDAGTPLTTSASSSAVALEAPDDWERIGAAETPAIPGLGLGGTVSLAPGERDASGVLGGMTDATGPTLLPAALRARARGELPAPDRVRLGDLEALRYRDVAVRGFDRPLTLFAVPTSAGVATVACYAPSPDAAASAPSCEAIAQTLDPLRGRAYPLATPPAVERALRAATRRLDRERRDGRRALARARTGAGQAKAARSVAAAYATAAGQLRELDVSPMLADAKAGTLSALDSAHDAYRKLATSAAAGDKTAYDAAGRAVRHAERRVERGLSSFGEAE